MPQPIVFILSFVAVLALIGVAAWLVRRFAGNRLGANTNRSRMPRLAVIDAAAVDGRRRLVLVRRDNIEHLLMIGGPTDIVVESNIVRAMPARDQVPQRAGAAEPAPPRIAPLPDSGWGDGEAARSETSDQAEAQMQEPPSRPVRPAFADEMRRPVMPERRSDSVTAFAPEPLGNPLGSHLGSPLGGRPESRPELRGEPMPSRVTSRNEPTMPRPPRTSEAPKGRAPERAAAPPPPIPPTPTADQNLAEMAQRLEAALRRPGGEPLAPPVAAEPPPGRPARNEQSMAPPIATQKSGFENLEDEMASLLGRPKTPS
jgi:flagellar biogenesis protein FliO